MPTYQPVGRSGYAGRRWRSPTHYLSERKQEAIPLSPTEVFPASAVMPVAFARHGRLFEPVAIVGRQAGENLFVGPRGQWLGTYLPQALRNQPFQLSRRGGTLTLCVDTDSEWLTQDGEHAFFDGENLASPLRRVLEALTQWESERASPMKLIMAALAQQRLLIEWELPFVEPDGTRIHHPGLYRIDTERLNTLNGSALEALHRVHALPIIYAHRISTFHLHLLDHLAKSNAPRAAIPDTIIGESSDGIIKFNF